jgi:hypothetical protein
MACVFDYDANVGISGKVKSKLNLSYVAHIHSIVWICSECTFAN